MYRKLATMDELSSLVFHVALDNTLVINEVSEYISLCYICMTIERIVDPQNRLN